LETNPFYVLEKVTMKSRTDEEVTLEGTLALIKPDVVHKEDQILELIRLSDLRLIPKFNLMFFQNHAYEHMEIPIYSIKFSIYKFKLKVHRPS